MDRANFDFLLDDAIRTATHFLSRSAEFFPFAVAKMCTGEVRHIQAMTEDDRPTSQQVLDVLLPKLREAVKTDLYVAVAIVSNVEWTDTQTGEQSNAIRVGLEGAGCDPVTCFLPYQLRHGDVILGEIRATQGSVVIFQNG